MNSMQNMGNKIVISRRKDGTFKRVYFEYCGLDNKPKNSYLNLFLLDKQKVTDEQVVTIAKTYREMISLVKRARSINLEKHLKRIRKLAAQHREAEFRLQEAWNFKRDERFHKYWYTFPHCSCPKMDNQDAFGTDRYIINGSCPIHGQ